MDKVVRKKLDEFISEYKTVSMEEVNRHPRFMNIKVFDCILNNGMHIVREQCMRNNGDGHVVTILPVTADKKIVMVAQPRVFTPLTVGFEFPAGYVENYEEPKEAAKRELLEETGYLPGGMHHLISYQGDPGCSKAFNHCFVATECLKKFDQNLDDSEYVHYFECSLDDAMEMMNDGYLVGSSSIVTLNKVYEKRRNYGI